MIVKSVCAILLNQQAQQLHDCLTFILNSFNILCNMQRKDMKNESNQLHKTLTLVCVCTFIFHVFLLHIRHRIKMKNKS